MAIPKTRIRVVTYGDNQVRYFPEQLHCKSAAGEVWRPIDHIQNSLSKAQAIIDSFRAVQEDSVQYIKYPECQ